MGKNIFITGASSGIGQTIARHLVAKGHRVIGASRKAESTEGKITRIPLDVTDDVSVATASQQAIAALTTVDVLINCAGYGLYGAIEDATIAEAQSQFDTNYFGTVRVTQAFLPHFRSKQQGLIINIGSMGGLMGMPFQGHYSASKFALEGYTESLRMELKPFNICVCNVNPGDVHTAFTSNRKFTSVLSAAYREKSEQLLTLYENDEKNGAAPLLIAQLVERLISREGGQSVRYVVGKRSQTMSVVLKRLVGERLFERIMQRVWQI